MKRAITISLTILIILTPFWLSAQKLPKIQEGSVYAPEDIKIDGKLTEWDDKFQAYNPANYIFYTISNDDNNLYLIVHVSGEIANSKVLKHGLTFSIHHTVTNVAVTYPAFTNKGRPMAEIGAMPIDALQGAPFRYQRYLSSDTVTHRVKIDSLVGQSTKQIKELFKDIQVTGVKQVADSVISIYNQEGFKVGASFNRLMEYSYELAIPLKYLGEDVTNGEKFDYNIRLNAQATIKVSGGRPPFIMHSNNPIDLFRSYDTDFSGEYVLAKKK